MTARDAPVAFVCAMPMELTPLAARLGLTETARDGLTLHEGSLGGRPVVAVVTGMGTAYASDGTRRMLDAVTVAHVLSVGITGALDDDTPIGTLVMPEVVVHADLGSEHRPAPLGDHPTRGTMWTSDHLTTDLTVVAELRGRGVVAFDMETAAIARVCEERGVPWSVFRAFSDRATDGSVTEEVFALSNLDGTPNREAIGAYFEAHPDALATMAELARGAELAADAAAEAAIRACSSL